MPKKKWSKGDIFILILEIITPVISVTTCLIPSGQQLSADARVAIISAGVSIPIILLQFSMTQGQTKLENDIQDVMSMLKKTSDKMNHLSPILEMILLSGNERVKRFAYRRLEEVYKTLNSAVNSNDSGNLRPSEYYQELLYLSELITKDKDENKNKFSGEIWAMTGFAEDEWIADDGYERLWTEKLREMVDQKRIKTRRLCLIPDSLYATITKEKFTVPSEQDHSFWGFIKLLQDYYSNESTSGVTEHYIIRERDNEQLAQIRGFFAIKLTNGDLHMLYGETVDSNGALTAKVLFDPDEIKTVRRLFELYTRTDNRIDQELERIAKRNGFIDFLKYKGIEFLPYDQ